MLPEALISQPTEMHLMPTPEHEVSEPLHTAQSPRKSAGLPCSPSKKTLRKHQLINRNKRCAEYQKETSMSKNSTTDEHQGAAPELYAPSC